LQTTESLETVAETLQTLICDIVAAIKVEIDRLQTTESVEIITDTLQALICDLDTVLALNNYFADLLQ